MTVLTSEAEAVDRHILSRYQDLAIEVLRGAAVAAAYSKDPEDTANSLQFLSTQTAFHDILGMDVEDVHNALVRPIIEAGEKPLVGANGGRALRKKLTAPLLEQLTRRYASAADAARAVGVHQNSIDRALKREGVKQPAKWMR